jgi:hypothetical protein
VFAKKGTFLMAMRRLIPAISIVICLAQAAVSQNAARSKPSNPASGRDPSLAETTAWIKAALASNGHVYQERTSFKGAWQKQSDFTISLTSADACRVSFYQLTTALATFGGTHPYQTNVTTEQTIFLNFRDLDPASAKLTEQPAGSDQDANYTDGGVFVDFQTTNLAKSVEVNVKSSVPTEDVATRLETAMSRAIALCGGKKSTF